MGRKENIEKQIRDIDEKMKRLQVQKQLLQLKLKRKEEHSQRINNNNRNGQRISSDPLSVNIED